VLQVVDSLGVGGAETWLMELLRLWSASGGVKTHILATGGRESVFDEQARSLGARTHYLRYGRDRLAAFSGEFRALLRSGGFDAIHDHQDYASGWHYLAGLGALPPVRVTHVHNPWLHIGAYYGVTPQRRLTAAAGRRLVGRFATHVCGTSREALRAYGFETGRLGRPRTVVAHCGFDVGRYAVPSACDRLSVLAEFGFPPDAKLALFVGRLDRDLEVGRPQNHKNSWFAVLTAAQAARADPRVRLLMAGAGDAQRTEIEARIAAFGLADRVRLVGVRNDVPRLMRAADTLLFPSVQEGLGMVAVEAQAAGLPVLASTAVPSEAIVMPELYQAMPLTASPAEWATALIASMDQPRRDPFSCSTALEASPFAIATSARQLEAIYAGDA
jgi:glycosyltransferase involved in cell wall biosynthesis